MSERDLVVQLAVANATITALLSGQIDAVLEPGSSTPVLLAKAHAALRESEERYRDIVEATSDGIIRSDATGRVVYVNRRFSEMLGYEPSEMTAAAFAFMSSEETEGTLRHKDGSEIAVSITISRLFGATGLATGHLWIVRDVTERNKLLSQLMVSDRMASVGTLAAGVAHEINNPLAAVIANLDYIADNLKRAPGEGSATQTGSLRRNAWLLEEVRAPLDDAREAAERVRFIVRDLRIFSRSPSEEPTGPVNVKSVMESSLRMGWNEIRHRARLVKHYDVVPDVAANEARLGQVFLNLVVNAAQALPAGSAEDNEIGVRVRLAGDRVIVEVSDTGPGIPPEIIGRIFEAFFTTKGVGIGTGLGLAICHRIVKDLGGELTVQSEVGRGTTFRVALPIAAHTEGDDAEPTSQLVAAGRHGRILVVDDDAIVLRSVKRALAREHDVVDLGTATAALARCAGGEEFDLILCDLMMPDMTGMDLYHALSELAPEQAGRMIFLTGGAFTDKARSFLSDGPREHLEKPFDPANLRALVRRCLR